MFHSAATVDEVEDDSVSDRVSAWKLLPATPPVCWIRKPTQSPVVLSVASPGRWPASSRWLSRTAWRVHCPAGRLDLLEQQAGVVPDTPSTSAVPCSSLPCATFVAGLGWRTWSRTWTPWTASLWQHRRCGRAGAHHAERGVGSPPPGGARPSNVPLEVHSWPPERLGPGQRRSRHRRERRLLLARRIAWTCDPFPPPQLSSAAASTQLNAGPTWSSAHPNAQRFKPRNVSHDWTPETTARPRSSRHWA